MAWQKKLFIKQPFPDNHVDASFLSQLRKNVNVPCHDYVSLVHASTALTQHLSTIVIFVCVFWAVVQEKVSATQLVFTANLFTLVGYGTWMWWIRGEQEAATAGKASELATVQRKQQLKAAMIFLMVLLGVSPVLKTLTEDTSSDTIATLTLTCFLVNYAFTDYSMARRGTGDGEYSVAGSSARGLNPIALNAAIFASVLLASRLDTRMHVFGLMSLAVNWFALFPLLKSALRSALPGFVNTWATVLMVGVVVLLFHELAATRTRFASLATVYLAAVLFVTFVAPLWFIRLQRFKNNIHGPWDEARIAK